LFSPLGFAIAFVIFAALAWQFWVHGGNLFSPGPLTAIAKSGILLGGVAAHSQIEACAACHQPLKTSQSQLCIACHKDIQLDNPNNSDIHGSISSEIPCFSCHSDHRGESFDPTTAARNQYDHSQASFSLLWHQVNYDTTPMVCESCHTREDFQVSEAACAQCHTQADSENMTPHIQTYGENCLSCHDGKDRMTRVNHQILALPLQGAHLEIDCIACHVGGQFEGIPSDCVNCHEEPAIHLGVFSQDCAACHSAAGWTPAVLDGQTFDHAAQTNFSLVHHTTTSNGTPMVCSDCHQQTLQSFSQQTCITCHRQDAPVFMETHFAQFGTECTSCHDGVDRMANFDHASVFPLDGAHANLDCQGCHENQQFVDLPMDCVGCHQEPAIHSGVFGLKCQNCHSTQAWSPARLNTHDFPLNHGDQGEIECQTCHPATYLQYTCDACHEPGEMARVHSEQNITNIVGQCLTCHPTGLKEEGENKENE